MIKYNSYWIKENFTHKIEHGIINNDYDLIFFGVINAIEKLLSESEKFITKIKNWALTDTNRIDEPLDFIKLLEKEQYFAAVLLLLYVELKEQSLLPVQKRNEKTVKIIIENILAKIKEYRFENKNDISDIPIYINIKPEYIKFIAVMIKKTFPKFSLRNFIGNKKTVQIDEKFMFEDIMSMINFKHIIQEKREYYKIKIIYQLLTLNVSNLKQNILNYIDNLNKCYADIINILLKINEYKKALKLAEENSCFYQLTEIVDYLIDKEKYEEAINTAINIGKESIWENIFKLSDFKNKHKNTERELENFVHSQGKKIINYFFSANKIPDAIRLIKNINFKFFNNRSYPKERLVEYCIKKLIDDNNINYALQVLEDISPGRITYLNIINHLLNKNLFKEAEFVLDNIKGCPPEKIEGYCYLIKYNLNEGKRLVLKILNQIESNSKFYDILLEPLLATLISINKPDIAFIILCNTPIIDLFDKEFYIEFIKHIIDAGYLEEFDFFIYTEQFKNNKYTRLDMIYAYQYVLFNEKKYYNSKYINKLLLTAPLEVEYLMDYLYGQILYFLKNNEFKETKKLVKKYDFLDLKDLLLY